MVGAHYTPTELQGLLITSLGSTWIFKTIVVFSERGKRSGDPESPALPCHPTAEAFLMFPRHSEEQKIQSPARDCWPTRPLRSGPAHPSTSASLHPHPPHPYLWSHRLQLHWLLSVPQIYQAFWRGLCTPPTSKCLHGCHLLVSQVSTQMSPPQRGFPDHLPCDSFSLSLSAMSAPFYFFLWLSFLVSETFSCIRLFALLVCLHHWNMLRPCRRVGSWSQQV